MRVRSPVSSWCYDRASRSMGCQNTWSFNSTALRFSDADNKLAVVGCSALAYIGSKDGDVENRYVVGCHAQCASRASLPADGAPCNGTGCCLTPVQPGISYFDVAFDDRYNSTAVAGFSPCGYAVLVEEAAFQFRANYVTTGALMDDAAGTRLSAVLDWAVGNQTCRDVQRKNTTAYACLSANSECVDLANGPTGYLCNCSKGYQGNPYILGGCQDINKCEVKGKYPCQIVDTCINTMGGYKCPCPAHKRGTPDEKCEDYKSGTLWQIVVGVSIGVVMLALGTSCTYAIQEKRRLALIKSRHFRQHGRLLLFEEMKKSISKQGVSFTLFTRQELQEATGDFDERHLRRRAPRASHVPDDEKSLAASFLSAARESRLDDLLDERINSEVGAEALVRVAKLAKMCLEMSGERRPSMREVAKELDRIRKISSS
ncbi:hypothetical protein ACQ4PT_006617 [Festuca glaucescens]